MGDAVADASAAFLCDEDDAVTCWDELVSWESISESDVARPAVGWDVDGVAGVLGFGDTEKRTLLLLSVTPVKHYSHI